MSEASTSRRKANEAANNKLRRKQAKVSGRQPLRDPEYLEFLRTLRCCVPGCRSFNLHAWMDAGAWTEAAHVGERGLRQKCSDREALPICAWHHRMSPDSHHVLGRRFWQFHGLDKEALIAAYNLAYGEIKAEA